MTQEKWTAVDAYFEKLFIPEDPVLAAAITNSLEAGLPDFNVSPMQGALLHLLAQIQGAKNILEIGTLGGYSTIWFARALPADGKIITLEYVPHHAEIARKNIDAAGVGEMVEIRVGPALDNLPELENEGYGPFDLIFIDADKPNNPYYLEWALRLSRPGTLIILDNIVRDGNVADAESRDASVIGAREFSELAAATPQLTTAVVQTVGSKGYDGFALLRVNET